MPTANDPTLAPTVSEPTNMPTSTSVPTRLPTPSQPTKLPTLDPSFSTPTWAPSDAPTTPCLSFEAYCSNSKFNGIYNFNGYSRKWFAQSGDAVFSVSSLPDSSLHWSFSFPNDDEILLSDSYQSRFDAIPMWSLQDRSSSSVLESTISCAFACSVTVTPSASPTTSIPTPAPTSPSPTSATRYSLTLENHLVGDTSMSETDQIKWKNAIARLMNGPEEIIIVSMKSMVPEGRRALTNPELNVTAEVFFSTEQARNDEFSNLDTMNTHMNSLLEVYFPINDLTAFDTVYIGLAGQFTGEYYVPTMMPTSLPTIDTGVDIEIVIDGSDPDLDDITNITDTVTGTTTTVINVVNNDDGTTTVILACPECDPSDDVTTDVENSLDAGNIPVVSVQPFDSGAKSSGGDSEALRVVSSGTTWMLVALITASIFGLYILFTGRRKIKRCMTCTQKEKILEVPQGLIYDIAQPHVMGKAFPKVTSGSLTAMTRGNSFSSVWDVEGDDTHLEAIYSDDEGNVTIAIAPTHTEDGDIMTGCYGGDAFFGDKLPKRRWGGYDRS
eukprot:TRINITY_DN1454_c0_g1_i14.p1 TRINITY_DN1454_c0_g1~~TRINITY_DN1454_c0_g1_i14.p1  ORF type:complete len:554 (+),score=104.09 TRINITY_DN1454_c0_g1_i14:410-2071(+)